MDGTPRKARPRRRSWWMVTAREARVHAILLAVMTWLVSMVITVGGSAQTSLLGVLHTPDFVHFYTVGVLAREGRIADAYDWQALHARQSAILPESAQFVHPPLYPPQAALLFIPFSYVSYTSAMVLWAMTTMVIYGLVVWRAWAPFRERLGDRVLVFAAAAGFPPFWQTVMNGQFTALVLGPCLLAWLAIRRGHHLAAGFALGLLAMKPQFGLPFAAIVLASRDWRMLSGAVLSVAAQALAVWLVLGTAAFESFAAILPTIVSHSSELEPKPFQSHSIRSLFRLLPTVIGVPAWIFLTGAVLWRTAKSWLSDAPVDVRFGVVVFAAVLVSPHALVYDVALLALPLIWFGAYFAERAVPREVEAYGALVYALFLTLLFPTAALIRIQASVIVMLALFWMVDQRLVGTTAGAGQLVADTSGAGA